MSGGWESELGEAYDYGSGLVDEYGAAAVHGLLRLGEGALNYASSAGTSIYNNYMTVLNSVEDYTKSIVEPVKDVLDTVTKMARSINDNLIEPIVNPIKNALAEYHTLKDEFHNDLKHGLTGLVAMPGQVADALTSVDSVLARSNEQLAEGQVAIATDVLAPSIHQAGIYDGVFQAYTSSITKLRGAVPDTEFPHVDLESPAELPGLKALLNGAVEFVLHPGELKQHEVDQANELLRIYRGGITGTAAEFADVMKVEAEKAVAEMTPSLSWITRAIFELAMAARGVDLKYEQQAELWRQDLNVTTPAKLLGLGEAIAAQRRGIITESERILEGLKNGVDDSRQRIAYELQTFLVGIGQAIDWHARGLISTDTRDRYLFANNVVAEDIEPLVAAATTLASPRELLAILPRLEAGAADFLPESLGTAPPADVRAQYDRVRISQEQADLDWAAHWKIPPVAWWMTAYFRGVRTYSELEAAARAENIPPDVIPDLIGIEQETIQQWMLPDIIATGLVSDDEFGAYAAYIGMEPKSAALLLAWGKTKLKQPEANAAADLAKVNQSTSTTLYDAGTIDRDTLLAIYRAHGYTADAAELAVEAVDLKRLAKDRVDTIERLAAEVDIGQRTVLSAIDAAHSDGFTAREIEKLESLIQHKLLGKTKLPSESQLGKLAKAELLTTAQYVAGLELIGYSPEWSRMLAALELGITLIELEALL